MFKLQIKKNGEVIKKIPFGTTPTKEIIQEVLQYDPEKKAEEKAKEAVSGLVNFAPETLDTLKEIATAINNDPNFYNTIKALIDNKMDKIEASDNLKVGTLELASGITLT